jgi:hypothetical protein
MQPIVQELKMTEVDNNVSTWVSTLLIDTCSRITRELAEVRDEGRDTGVTHAHKSARALARVKHGHAGRLSIGIA